MNKKNILLLALPILTASLLTACQKKTFIANTNNSDKTTLDNNSKKKGTIKESQKTINTQAEQMPDSFLATTKDLANALPKKDDRVFMILNGGDPALNLNSIKPETIVYTKLDDLKRSRGVLAYLTPKDLVPNSKAKYIEPDKSPIGYKKDNNNFMIKGYLLDPNITNTFSQNALNDLRNLYPSTAMLYNKYYRLTINKVRSYLVKQQSVLIKITPIYHEKELVPRGIIVQAKTKKDGFNVYLANVISGYKVDYNTGTLNVDKNAEYKDEPLILDNADRKQLLNNKKGIE